MVVKLIFIFTVKTEMVLIKHNWVCYPLTWFSVGRSTGGGHFRQTAAVSCVWEALSGSYDVRRLPCACIVLAAEPFSGSFFWAAVLLMQWLHLSLGEPQWWKWWHFWWKEGWQPGRWDCVLQAKKSKVSVYSYCGVSMKSMLSLRRLPSKLTCIKLP